MAKTQNRQYQMLTRTCSKRNSHPLLGPLSYKVKHTLIIQLSNPASSYLPKELASLIAQLVKNLPEMQETPD